MASPGAPALHVDRSTRSRSLMLAAMSLGFVVVQLDVTVVNGGAVGLVVPPMTSVLLGTVAPEWSGIASGALNTMRQTGSVLGVALLGSLAAAGGDLAAGVSRALFVGGAFVAAGCVVALGIQEKPR